MPPRTVWIVSSGRTGTQFLAHYFEANFATITALHEPAPRVRTRLTSHAYVAGACSRERVIALLEAKKRRIDALRCELYVESNPFLWGGVGCLDEVFEAPMIVHVVRDPRSQVRSSLNHGTSTGLKGLANRLFPYWYPKTPESEGNWLERAAGVWSLVNRCLSDAGAQSSDYRVVRYEELFDETNSGLRRLCEEMGLAFAGAGARVDPASRINRAAGSVLEDWESWTNEQCASLERIAQPLMARYGYGTEPAWRARLERGEHATEERGAGIGAGS